MKTQRLLIALTVVNLGLMVFVLTEPRPATAELVAPATADSVPPVLRGSGLEIFDDRGRVRASIKVYPADPTVKMPDGTTGYPETVLLRLINSKGRPNIKIDASETGGGVMVGGESDPTYASLSARGANTSLKMINKDSREQTFKP
jgi:hypothetical protein